MLSARSQSAIDTSARPIRPAISMGVDKFDNPIMEKGAQPNKVQNKTTVSDFVTHEPFNRTSSTALKKKYVNDAIKLIAEENPELSASELGTIKSTLISQKSIDGITAKINNLTKLNSTVKRAFVSGSHFAEIRLDCLSSFSIEKIQNLSKFFL